MPVRALSAALLPRTATPRWHALLVVALLLAGVGPPAAVAQSDARQSALAGLFDRDPQFLPVDEAFRFEAVADGKGAVLARWTMPPGYYLYRHQLSFKAAGGDAVLGEPEIPPGEPKHDEWFGAVEVWHDQLEVAVPVSARGDFSVTFGYQGCADAGLCYPPETRTVAFRASDLRTAVPGPAAGAPEPAGRSGATAVDGVAGTAGAPPVTEESRLAGLLAGQALPVALLAFFVAGIGLAFTPCVLPMVPILAGIIAGQQAMTRRRGFTLALAYVTGMALTYALLGTLMGLFGARFNVQAMLQAPLVLGVAAALFVALALAMFGVWELRLPAAVQQRLDDLSRRQSGGAHVPVAVMGALSALIVSPCVSAPLVGALLYIGASGDAVLGGLALLALGFGMGVPLLVVGASGGALLPRAGAWMVTVKGVFGVGLLAVALWLVARIIPAPLALALWGALAVGSGVALGLFEGAAGALRRATGVVLVLWGALQLVGAAAGGGDPLRPLAPLAGPGGGADAPAEAAAFVDVRGVAALEAALAGAAGRPVLVDLYADWCIECIEMERRVFVRADVQARLRDFVLVRADVTANSADDRALLERFSAFGPPGLHLFGRDGHEAVDWRIRGAVDAPTLLRHLDGFLAAFPGS